MCCSTVRIVIYSATCVVYNTVILVHTAWIYLFVKFCIVISANFENGSYRVHEHDGSMAPKIVLTEPSPCCFMVHAQLQNDTAFG